MRPREYLSYSQKSLWKRNPDEYIKKYVHEGAQYITREMAFGKKMSVALEEERESDDHILNGMMAKIPKLEVPEFPLRSEIKIGGEILPLYSKLDTAKKDLSAFKEYKTGKTVWTQKKVDEDPQITFYVTSIYVLTKQIVRDIELVWIETMNDPDAEGGIACTGNIYRFKTQRSMGQVINEIADMRKVWREIGARCEKELI